ncbi:hypothetical protein GE061_008817 [Apolygus lucorum]|uniref:Uncharacterized protein n=1 Tax=Apolygus lucorum TaxID=248454 RepID=A0A6A4IQL5_APOLU|nr:hypothetical protein GE061_008817 [Apolygus lucorum]
MPFTVEVMSFQQLQVALTALQRQGWLDLHIDSTGSVVRGPQGVDRSVYYYAGVIHLGSGLDKPFPVFEQITCRQDSSSIGKWLAEFQAFCLDHNKWPIADRVIIDGSQALLKAILNTWGLTDTFTYLNTCYKYVVEGSPLRISRDLRVVVRFCCSHLMKNITRDIDARKSKLNSYFRNFLKEGMANLFKVNDIWHASLWVDHLAVVLLTPQQDPSVNSSLNNLQKIVLGTPVDKDVAYLKLSITVAQPSLEAGTTLKNSMFYQHFVSVVERRKSLISTNASIMKNEYYDPELLDTILTKYFTYYPMWAGVQSYPGNDPTRERCSNAIVENFIGLLKTNVMDKVLHLRATRFLRVVRMHVLSVSKEYLFNISKSRSTPRKSANNSRPFKTAPHAYRSSSKKLPSSNFGASVLKPMGLDFDSHTKCNDLFGTLDAPPNLEKAIYADCKSGDQKDSTQITTLTNGLRVASQNKSGQLCTIRGVNHYWNQESSPLAFKDLLPLRNHHFPGELSQKRRRTWKKPSTPIEAEGNKTSTSKAIKQIVDALLVLKGSGVGGGNPAAGPSTQDESSSEATTINDVVASLLAFEAKKGGGRRTQQNPRRRRKNKPKNNFAATIRVTPDGTISVLQKPVWGKGSSRQHPYPKGGKGGKKSPQKEPPKPDAPKE